MVAMLQEGKDDELTDAFNGYDRSFVLTPVPAWPGMRSTWKNIITRSRPGPYNKGTTKPSRKLRTNIRAMKHKNQF
jgi:hypothetical protein